jgi:hypothetical protein
MVTNGASISFSPSVMAVVVLGLTMRMGSGEAMIELEGGAVSSREDYRAVESSHSKSRCTRSRRCRR